MNGCGLLSGELHADVRGELPADSRTEVREHLETCPDCRREHEEMTRFQAILAAWREPAPAADDSPALLDLRRRLQQAESTPPAHRRPARRTVALFAAAAVAATVLGLVFLLPSSPPDLPSLVPLHGEILVAGRAAPLDAGVSLRPGESIVAKTPARLRIDGPRTIEAVLGAGTRLSATGPREIRVETGRVLATVAPGDGTVEFVTPHGRVAVPGTRLNLVVAADRTEAAVLDGRVEVVGDGDPVAVEAGFAVLLAAGARPQPPRPVDLWQVREWCSRPRLILSLLPSGLSIALVNDNPAAIRVKPFDPDSAAWSLEVAPEAGDGGSWQVRLQEGMTAEDPATRHAPGLLTLSPGEEYRLLVDPGELDLPPGVWRLSAVYKPYNVPEEARGRPVESPAVRYESK